ncbi:MAG: hypothetical protein M1836_007869 [Candelina mexicana]|nr:MAG: hypothetical protein M1836_007869 [Candelina mexicana]
MYQDKSDLLQLEAPIYFAQQGVCAAGKHLASRLEGFLPFPTPHSLSEHRTREPRKRLTANDKPHQRRREQEFLSQDEQLGRESEAKKDDWNRQDAVFKGRTETIQEWFPDRRAEGIEGSGESGFVVLVVREVAAG